MASRGCEHGDRTRPAVAGVHPQNISKVGAGTLVVPVRGAEYSVGGLALDKIMKMVFCTHYTNLDKTVLAHL